MKNRLKTADIYYLIVICIKIVFFFHFTNHSICEENLKEFDERKLLSSSSAIVKDINVFR